MEFIDRTAELKAKLEKALEEALVQIGTTGTSSVKANAPVSVGLPSSGNLRRSYKFAVDKEKLEVSIGVADASAYYAEFVEFKPVANGGRPHLRVTLDGEKENFKKIVESMVKEVK